MPTAKCDVVDLSSGRRVYLRELRQYFTYEGLLEGLPTDEMNRRQVERLVADHRDNPYPNGPYLIPPTETPIPHQRDRPSWLGSPMRLPEVTCIGRFTSLEPARDWGRDFSGLMVIWFQNEFVFPIDPAVLAQLRAVDWEAHAADLDY